MTNTFNYIRAKLNAPNATPDFLSTKHIPSLDGWRAVAITMVILGHAKLTVSKNSFYYKFAETFIYAELGVRIFFVLSGFLITTLLIKEFNSKGKINFKYFFIKRILRIFPVLYLYLSIIFIFNQILSLNLNLDHFLGPILYLNNFSFFSGTWLTGHTWSLAVEEQFYLIWPFLFSFLKKKLWVLCLILIFWIPFFKVLYYYNQSYYEPTLGPFITHADAIFSGSLLAILSFKNFFNAKQKIWKTKGLDLMAMIIIFVFMYCVHRGLAGYIAYPFTGTVCNIMICILLLRTVINSKTLIYNFLNQKTIMKLGIISYSLYIWQQLLIVPIDGYEGKFSAITFPINIILSLVIACLSYHYFERYFLNLKTKFINNNTLNAKYYYRSRKYLTQNRGL